MLGGSMVALVTPMNEDGSIAYETLDRLVEFHIDNQTDALVVAGTTGESATLTVEEHCAVIARVISKVNQRIPVIAGTGANATAEAIALTQQAKTLGADAVLLVAPYYNKPTQQGLYLHYKAIAEAVSIPQILYNVPGRTASDILPETVAKLSALDNIIGIKEATGEISRIEKIKQLLEGEFAFYTGEDNNTVDFIAAGGAGVISVTANVAPKAMSEMCLAALNGQWQRAREINSELAALHQNLFIESNPIPVKWALHQMQLITLGIRLPLTVLSEHCHSTVLDALAQANINSFRSE